MILGVYWAFKFPEKIYYFDFFKYRGTSGGHAHSPSELYMDCKLKNPDLLIGKLKKVIEDYPFGRLFIYQRGDCLKIKTGSYFLFDYDFLLIRKVEELLKSEQITNVNETDTKGAELIKIIGDKRFHENNSFSKKDFFQMVGSEITNYNSELYSIRFDCNILNSELHDFIIDLKNILKEENITLAFYKDKIADNRTNLMMFFTNGRQGLNLSPLIVTDACSLENKIENLKSKYSLQFGFIEGHYPNSNRKEIMISDSEFLPRI
jgi:hypothetical protein